MLLETNGLGKSFGVVTALRDVSFNLKRGEVHGLMGENGAGKSTLIELLTGFHQPSAGEILLDGKPVSFDSPRAAQTAGVAAVYQEINLIPERSVAANIFLAREPRQFGILTNTAKMVEEAAAILGRYGLRHRSPAAFANPGARPAADGLDRARRLLRGARRHHG